MRGRLLVAAPGLVDPNFYRTVVLLIGHDDDGSLGVVLNRPTEAFVADHLPGWAAHCAEPPVVFWGGPVEHEVAVGLAEHAPPPDQEGWAPIVGTVGTVDLGGEVGRLRPGSRLRVYSGYAGWGPGQLGDELAEGAWLVVEALPDDAFHPAEGLWRTVLARQRSLAALFSTFPDEPAWN